MFPNQYRLKSREVKAACSRGSRFHVDSLVAYVISRGDSGPTRYAASVPKHADKRATRRNRLKRLVREAVRYLIPQTCPGSDVVLIVTGKNSPDSLKGWVKSVQTLFSEAGLLCGTS